MNNKPASHRRRNAAIAALIVILAVIGYVSLTLRPQEVIFYRVIDDHTLVVRAQAGVLLWPHLSGLDETATEVVVTVSGIGIAAPSTEHLYDVIVVLAQPLGDRHVIDGNSGLRVQLETAESSTPAAAPSAPPSALAVAQTTGSPTAVPATDSPEPQPTNAQSPAPSETPSASVIAMQPSASPAANPSPSSSPEPAPPTGDLASRVVADGDQVTATGWVQKIDGVTSICELPYVVFAVTSEAPCFGVPITDVDPATLPSWSASTGRTDWLTVRGTWTDGHIAVTSTKARLPDPYERRSQAPLPCPAPPDGWRPGDWTESQGRPLGQAVTVDSTLYAGPWTAMVPMQDGQKAIVAVVGNVGDLESARQQLAALSLPNFCVTKVDYPNATFAALENRLAKLVPTENWSPLEDFSWDRTWLQLRLLDEHAFQLLEPDADKMVVDPLVQRVSP